MARISKKKTYYWDACTFIAWLNGGKGHPSDVIAGLDEVARDVHDNRAVLCTSVNTMTEILQGKLTPDQRITFQNLFKRRNVIPINVDTRIAQKASEIRNYYNERGTKIKTTDAQHLATAIIYGVDEFHTLDGDGERQRPSDLLRLNGNVAGHPLHIRVPVAIQGSLLAGIGSLDLGGNGEEKKNKSTQTASARIQGGDSGSSEDQTTSEAESRQRGKTQTTPENGEVKT